MKPSFHIFANGKAITDAIKERLIGITVKDEPGIESDSIQITLEDDPPFELPKPGTLIRVALGYEDRLVDLGEFASRPVSIKGPPREATIEASVMERFPGLSEQKRRSWPDISLSAIVQKIAKEQGLTAKVSSSFSAVEVSHEEQTESDAAFLSRLSKRFDALFKIQEKNLIFFDRDSKLTPGGSLVPRPEISGLNNYDLKVIAERVYTGVRAHWWSKRKAKRMSILVGHEGTVFELKMLQKDGKAASHAATAKLRQTKRNASYLSFTIPGAPELFSGGRCIVRNLRPGLDGEWNIKSVEHSLSDSGFISKVTCEGLTPL